MGPSGALARTWLRRNLGVTVLLAVLVALVVGASGGAFAGARRAASALDRFVEYNQPPDVQVFATDGSRFDVEAVTSLPGVAGWSTGAYGLLSAQGPGGGPFPPGNVNPFVPIAADGRQPYRPHVVEGRVPRQDRPHEVALDEEAARRLGAAAGDTVILRLYTPVQMESLFGGGDFPPPHGAEVETTVTGVVRHAFDVTPAKPEEVDAVQLASSEVYPTLAFWDRYGDELAAYGDGTDGVEILLEGGVDAIPAFEEAVRSLPGKALVIETENDALTAVGDARQAVRFEAVATTMFGALILAAGLVLVGQAIARQVRAELEQGEVLRGIGLTRREVARAAGIRMSVVAVVGAMAGLGVGYAASASMPFGTAAKAEVDPGLSFDVVPLAGTAMVVVVLLVTWSARAAWRAQGGAGRVPTGVGLAARAAGAAAGAGAPVSVVFGLSQLGRGRARTPVRSSLGGVTIAMAAVVAVAVYGSTTDRFVNQPREHGWAWDLLVGDSDDETLVAAGVELLADDPDVGGFASVWRGSERNVGAADGRKAAISGVEPVAGTTYVQLIEGRPAERHDEVVLGPRSMERFDAELDGTVSLEGPAGAATYHVVGVAVLHQVMNDGFELDEGVVTSRDGLQKLFGDEMQLDRFIVDLADGVRPAPAIASLRDVFGPTVTAPVPPLDVASLRETQHLPLLLGLVIGAIGAGSLVHLLLVTVHRRRVQFAVLRALGATPSQVSSAVASMASATVVAASLVGLPAGVIAGRMAWTALGESIGAPTPPVVPVLAIGVGALVVVIVANVIAAVPGHLLRRVPPAQALRSE